MGEYMIDTSGFYHREGNTNLSFAPNWVTGPGVELHRETRDEQTYPVDGWYWFNSREEAYTFFGLSLPELL